MSLATTRVETHADCVRMGARLAGAAVPGVIVQAEPVIARATDARREVLYRSVR
jgi:hypothetical protein